MANEYSTVDCEEVQGTYRERRDSGSWTQDVTLACRWNDRNNLINDLRGRTCPKSPAGVSTLPIALAFGIREYQIVNGTDPTVQTFDHERAFVDVSWRIAQSGPGGGGPNDYDYYTETIEPTIEQFKLSNYFLRWGAGGVGRLLEPDELPTLPLYRERFSRTYVGISAPIPAPFTDLQGSINTNTVNSGLLGIPYAPRTVLYSNRTATTSISTDGTQKVNLTVNFIFRQEGWRSYWNADSQQLEEIYHVGGDALAWPPENDLSPVLI